MATTPIFLHALFESLAYALGGASFWWLRRKKGDALPFEMRAAIIAAAAAGALTGSKLLAIAQEPAVTAAHWREPAFWQGGKTVIGGILGGWLAVEIVKRTLKIKTATGDLFALPLCLGIAVGRLGCYFAGLADGTYGKPTTLPWGVDFGDGIARHPTQLYEIIFMAMLALWIFLRSRKLHPIGSLFYELLIGYLGWRFLIDFLKPLPPPIWLGVTTLQWASLIGVIIAVVRMKAIAATATSS